MSSPLLSDVQVLEFGDGARVCGVHCGAQRAGQGAEGVGRVPGVDACAGIAGHLAAAQRMGGRNSTCAAGAALWQPCLQVDSHQSWNFCVTRVS